MKFVVIVLALLFITADVKSLTCSSGATLTSGCKDCESSAGDSNCNYCGDNMYKFDAKTCKKCPSGSGRTAPTATVAVEAETVCVKCDTKLNCESCKTAISCTTCATGKYIEVIPQADSKLNVNNGCSADCKTWSTANLVPKTPTETSCVACDAKCAKCEFPASSTNPYETKCLQAEDGWFISPNASPSVQRCGNNCKKCTDKTTCTECMTGFATTASDKGNCTSSSTSTSYSQVLQVCLLTFLLAYLNL
jgi:hypothetical protein